MKYISLTQGQRAIADDTTYEWLNALKWYASRGRYGNFYAARHGFRKQDGKQPTLVMARIIMNAAAGQHVDHVSGDTLDNRKCNLRLCTAAENQHNQKPQTGKSSRWKGVSRYEHRWRACIKSEGKQYHLGLFAHETDAALAYNRAALQLHGAFARLNDILSQTKSEKFKKVLEKPHIRG